MATATYTINREELIEKAVNETVKGLIPMMREELNDAFDRAFKGKNKISVSVFPEKET